MKRKELTEKTTSKRHIESHLSDEELALRWNCSESFVKKERREKRLSYFKLGRSVRIPLSSVLKYEEERKVS